MRGRNLAYRLYAGLIVAAGVATLGWSVHTLVQGNTVLPPWWQAGIWLCTLVLAAVATVPLPRKRTTVRLNGVLEFAAVLVSGPALACVMSVVAQAVAGGRQRDSRRFLHLGQTALAVGGAGLVYTSLGGALGDAFVLGGSESLLVVLSGALYLLLHHVISNLARVLETLQLNAVQLRPLTDRLLWESILVPLAIPVALAHAQLGVLALGLVVAPLILARHFATTWNSAMVGHIEAVRSLTSMLDATDPFTRGHAYRIAKMCTALGRRLGMSDLELEELEYAALLHDIGRTAIQHEIRLKPGELDESERSALEMHPIVGRELLERIGLMPAATDIVLYHHERPDGLGYPTGLTLKDIPLGSHIIMVVAAFDAMTSDRPYRRGLSPDVALEEMLSQAGQQFHSDVVETFIELYSNDELFADFEPHVLADYANGDCASRAISVHLRRNELRYPGAEESQSDTLIIPEIVVDLDEEDTMPERTSQAETVALTTDGNWRLEIHGQTDIGQVRSNNEDSFGVFPHQGDNPGCLLVVADGMGGANAGEVASRLAVQTVRDAYLGDEDTEPTAKLLDESILLANEVIHTQSTRDLQYSGMGTTCVVASFRQQKLTIAHVGDSRAYLVSQNEIHRLTRDHNLAEELIHATGGEAPSGAQHVLTRSLGSAEAVQVEVSKPFSIHEGDTLVLCTDGLSGVVETEEILQAVRRAEPAEACKHLVELANARGGPDNVTVTVARVRCN